MSDRLNADGLDCDLVTGQERVEVPGAQHVACTVEMASTTNVVEVAVIDEIQVRLLYLCLAGLCALGTACAWAARRAHNRGGEQRGKYAVSM